MSKRIYKAIARGTFTMGRYSLVPIRDEDKYQIMEWRNGQIDILRQKQPLTKEQQELYFANVIDKLFEQDRPTQFLFSYLEDGVLVGYGGLVHIDWESRNGEISFLIATERNNIPGYLETDWINYLRIIKKVAYHYLGFEKIYTYAYDIRPVLFSALNKSGFKEEGRLRSHVWVKERLADVLIHSFFFQPLNIRMAGAKDIHLYFDWANDPLVREKSFNSKEIKFDQHSTWFNRMLSSDLTKMYVISTKDGEPVGQVRIEFKNDEHVIGITVAPGFRGKGLSSKMLVMAVNEYFVDQPGAAITAYIKLDNAVSFSSFLDAGFEHTGNSRQNNIDCYKLRKTNH